MSYIPTASGVYTPTLTNVQNVATSTAYSCQWVRVRELVTVSGQIDIDPTLASTSTRVGVSFPIASTITNAYECAGTGGCPNNDGLTFTILGDVANTRALIQYETTDTTDRSFYFSFTYLLK